MMMINSRMIVVNRIVVSKASYHLNSSSSLHIYRSNNSFHKSNNNNYSQMITRSEGAI